MHDTTITTSQLRHIDISSSDADKIFNQQNSSSSISSSKAHQGESPTGSNYLRRRRIDEINCPCVHDRLDAKLINSRTLEIDLHRGRSCMSTLPSNMQRIYWTPIDPSERPKSGLVLPIDGVKYNYLKAIYDPENSYYSCTRNDGMWDEITAEQARACMDIIEDTCDNVMPQLCPFDATIMESVKNDVSSGGLILDQDRSCKNEPTTDATIEEEAYGIYVKTETRSSTTTSIKAALSSKRDVYFLDSDIPIDLSSERQAIHCTKLLTSTCSEWELTRSEDSLESCSDDPNFRLHGNFIQEDLSKVKHFITSITSEQKSFTRPEKNCDWVAQDPTRCRTLSRDSGKRAFESCRKTCGYCSCTDNSMFRFNGQSDKGCEWIKDYASKRCSLEGASQNCKATCGGSSCCQDNTDFRVKKMERRSCEWVGMKEERKSLLCDKRAIAVNCPDTCGFCPSS